MLGEQAFAAQAGNGIVLAAGFQQVGYPSMGGRAGRFLQGGLQHAGGLRFGERTHRLVSPARTGQPHFALSVGHRNH